MTWDPSKTTFDKLNRFFWSEHGPYSNFCSPRSRQYMSGVWPLGDEQRTAVALKVQELEASSGKKVQTTIGDITKTRVFRAEEYHQKFYKKRNRGF